MPPINSARWAALAPRIDALLTLPPLERKRALDELAANDPETAGQLRSLLDSRDAASRASFLGGVADGSVLPPSVCAGETLGAWTLVEIIGEGGMGSVWRARRSDGRFEGESAIKLLRTGLFDSGSQERFRREGAILARLRHPGIAQLLDAGITERGQPYLVLELVRGERIDHWCTAGALPLRKRIELFLQVLDAVSAAHGQLVIHRDLKPSNILVDEAGRVKLLDFGIARLQGDEAVGLTREGAFALTPEYAAPEQFEGGTLSMATDVYALGVVLYELLTGTHPSGLTQGAPLEYLRAASAGTFKPASEHVPAQKRALRGDLDNILAKALRPAAAERYGSVAALAEDLHRHLNHQPVGARPDALAYRIGKFMQRHRVGTVLAGLALLAVGAGVAGTVVQAARAERAAVRADRERDRALRQLHYAEATNEFVNFLLSESGGKSFTTVDLMTRAEGLLDKQFDKDPGVRGRLQLLVGDRYGNLERNDKAIPLLEQAQRSADEAHEPVLRADVDCTLATLLGDKGDTQRSQSLFDAALSTYRQAVPANPRGLAHCLLSLADTESASRGDPKSALAHAVEAMALFRSLPQGNAEIYLRARTVLGGVHAMLGHLGQAVDEYQAALNDMARLGRERSADALGIVQQMGVFLSKGGQTQRALATYQRALALSQGIEGSDDIQPALEANEAKALVDAGRAREAIPMFEHALSSASVRNNEARAAVTALQAAPAFCAIGDLRRCGALLARALTGLRATRPATHPFFGTWSLTSAQLALSQDQVPLAKEHLEHAVTIFLEAKERNPIAVRALTLLARVDQRLGLTTQANERTAQALGWAREASAGFELSAWQGIAQLTQAVVLEAHGERGAAEAALALALPHLTASLGEQAPETIEARRMAAELRGAARLHAAAASKGEVVPR
jgi:tetratricopeptide (TPR) repeat protein